MPLVACLTALAAALRVVGLDAKGFWLDEASTSFHVSSSSFGGMLEAVLDTESTPPLYFTVAWLWGKVFGTGEVGLRSLSALLGTATVPIAYLAAKELVSRRAALVTALLVAVNPLLVWYGQDARAYVLLVLLTTVSLLFFVRTLHAPGDRLAREAVFWTLASVLAIATHYFALFVILPEAVWLLRTRARARPVVVGTGVVLLAAIAFVVMGAAQREDASGWIDDTTLIHRFAQTPGIFLVGFEAPSPLAFAAIAAACAAVGLWLVVTRAALPDREGAILAGGLALAAVAGALVVSLTVFDYLLYRNLIPILIPTLIVLGAGFGARRAGATGATALVLLCAISVGVVIATADEPKYRREIWREAAHAIGEPSSARAVVATPAKYAENPLVYYLPGSRVMPQEGRAVAEIVVLGGARRELGSADEPRTPRPNSPPPAPAPGFRLVERYEGDRFTFFRYRFARAVVTRPDELARSRIDEIDSVVLFQPE